MWSQKAVHPVSARVTLQKPDKLQLNAMNILVIGGNRGIGLELCRQYAARGDRVIATCRNAPGPLGESGARILHGIDVVSAQGIQKLQSELEKTPVHLLIHNAGILSRENLDDLDFDRVQQQFIVNTLGPLRVIHALHGHLPGKSRIGIVSSRMGSIGDNTSGGMYGYRISKAAVNAAGVSLARDLEPLDIAVALLHPGLVATDMTGGRGIPPSKAASGLIGVMDRLTLANTGRFWHAEGYELPW